MEDEIEKKPFYDEEILGEGFGRLDLAMEKELHGKQSVWALIVMIAGAVLYGLYLVFAVFLDGTIPEDLRFLLFLLGVFPFAIGLVYTITYARLRRAAKYGAENRYRFGMARFYVSSSSASGEPIGRARYRYGDIKKLQKSEKYLFLTVKNDVQTGIFPILRESMSGETERFLVERVRAAHPKSVKEKGHR